MIAAILSLTLLGAALGVILGVANKFLFNYRVICIINKIIAGSLIFYYSEF